MRFDWDTDKAESNRRKHGVTFDEAASVFYDPFALTAPDLSDDDEDRERTLGRSHRSRVLLVVTTARDAPDDPTTRIISARPATPTEEHRYDDHLKASTQGGRPDRRRRRS